MGGPQPFLLEVPLVQLPSGEANLTAEAQIDPRAVGENDGNLPRLSQFPGSLDFKTL